MTRASDRWFGADAGGTYFENAFVLFDEEAATCARRSIGGGVAGRAGRASASLETYAATTRRGRSRARGGASEDESGGEDECVYGMDGDVVPRDAPVVMFVTRALGSVNAPSPNARYISGGKNLMTNRPLAAFALSLIHI